MKEFSDKEKFIELRAQGLSYDKISEKIGISKPTLIKWNQQYASEIANLIYFNVETTLERYKIFKINRIEILAHTLNKAFDELMSRDFKKLSNKDLVSMILVMEDKLKSEIKNVQFHTGEFKSTAEMDLNELIQEKTHRLSY